MNEEDEEEEGEKGGGAGWGMLWSLRRERRQEIYSSLELISKEGGEKRID